MLRNIQRAIRTTARVTPVTSKPGVARNLSFRTAHTTKLKAGLPTVQRDFLALRNYTTSSDDSSDKSGPPPSSQDPKDLNWLQFLESASNAPWLTNTPPDVGDRLRRSYSLLFQIILYLGRPLSNDVKEVEDATHQFLLAFNSAPVSVDSEIGRARHAIAVLTKQIQADISSAPQSSVLRSQHSQIFALADALAPLCDVHLQGVQQNKPPTTSEVVDDGVKWQVFWAKAQPIVLALGEELEKDGYGITEDLVKEAKAEQERKEKENVGSAGEGEK